MTPFVAAVLKWGLGAVTLAVVGLIKWVYSIDQRSRKTELARENDAEMTAVLLEKALMTFELAHAKESKK